MLHQLLRVVVVLHLFPITLCFTLCKLPRNWDGLTDPMQRIMTITYNTILTEWADGALLNVQQSCPSSSVLEEEEEPPSLRLRAEG